MSRWQKSPTLFWGTVIMIVIGGLSMGAGLRAWHMPKPERGTGSMKIEQAGQGSGNSKHPGLKEQLVDYRRKMPRGLTDRVSFLSALERWLIKDPIDCLNTLQAAGLAPLIDETTLAASIESVAATSPAKAMQLAGEIENPLFRQRLLTSIFRTAIKRNPETALDLYGNLPKIYGWKLRDELATALGKNGKPELFQKIMAHPSGAEVFGEAVTAWIGTRTKDALAFLEQQNEAALFNLGVSKAGLWDKIEDQGDPAARLNYLKKQPPGADRNEAICAAAGSLVAKNPAQWADLTAGIKSEVTIARIASDAAEKIAAKSPDQAIQLLDRISGVHARMHAARKTARTFILANRSQSNPASMIKWIQSVKDPIIAQGMVDEARMQKVPLPKDF